ncbi:hypothetical protein MNBD_NITROSPINAE01-958 [hydrothermal vent metagenome]|uniref:Uncharacterized protein n=1 Tax=hydrothermal vent metagenome TaxID=652676 RepID=A0A3B1C375_9ZZZZ
MPETEAPNIAGSLILLGILLFIVYRILLAINNQNQYESGTSEGSEGATIFKMPERRAPAPPAQVTLAPVPAGEDHFAELPIIDEAHTSLIDRGGLKLIGDFFVQEMPGYYLRAYTHPEHSLIGIIYRDPSDRSWVNLITEYQDGRIITTSSADEALTQAKRPKGMPLFNHPGMQTEQLLRRHKLETRGQEKTGHVLPENFTQFFASNYIKLRSVTQETPPPLPDTKQEGKILTFPGGTQTPQGQEPADADMPDASQLRAWLDAVYKAVPVPQEKREQFKRGLVWVLDSSGMNAIAETVSKYASVSVDEVEKGRWVIRTEAGAEDIISPGNLKGVELFEKVNASLPASKRFSKLPVKIKGVAFYNQIKV